MTTTSKVARILCFAVLAAMLIPVPGCTSRTLTITTIPPGAEVSVNRRPIGVTPIRVGFTHYGTYRIEIRKEKFETLVKEEEICPHWYGYDPITFVSDNAIPARINDDIYLHYVLKPEGEVSERNALLMRADQAKMGIAVNNKGETVNVAYTVPEKTPEQAAKVAKQNPEASTNGEPVKPLITVEPIKIKPIQAQAPEGPRIGPELGIKPVPENKPEVPKTEPRVEPKKEGPAIKPQKTEELIFDKPAPPKTETPPPPPAPKPSTNQPDTSLDVPKN